MTSPDLLLSVDVNLAEPKWSACVPEVSVICATAARVAFTRVGSPSVPASISVLLGDDATLAKLNHTFRGKSGATNVLSFTAGDTCPDGTVMLGDIAIAFETVCHEARVHGKSVSDHLSHMIVHGTLHLLGFDHESDAEAHEMEAFELQILASLGVAAPYDTVATEKVAEHLP